MLQGKTAVITGGSRGIGRAIALEMARQGANIAILYAGSREAAAETAQQARSFGVRCTSYQCNVADFASTAQAVGAVLEDFGAVDILVNNAGITRDGLILSMKQQDFDQVIQTDLNGAFYMIKQLYRHLMRRPAGRIINISSVSGLRGNSGQANYAAAKAGLIGLTKTTAKELAGRGVTCNAIAPGFIATDMTAAMPARARESAAEAIPMGRMGLPGEVAALAAFLASDSAGYITGEVIRVDGGLCI